MLDGSCLYLGICGNENIFFLKYLTLQCIAGCYADIFTLKFSWKACFYFLLSALLGLPGSLWGGVSSAVEILSIPQEVSIPFMTPNSHLGLSLVVPFLMFGKEGMLWVFCVFLAMASCFQKLQAGLLWVNLAVSTRPHLDGWEMDGQRGREFLRSSLPCRFSHRRLRLESFFSPFAVFRVFAAQQSLTVLRLFCTLSLPWT